MATEEKQAPAPASERLGDIEGRRAPVPVLLAIAVVASAIGIALGIAIDWFPTAAATQADDIDTLYDVLIFASVPVFVLVQGYVMYAVWRWRMRKGEEEKDGPPIHGNTRLEVIWTIIPALMMLALTTYSYVVLKDIEEAPAAGRELNVRVVGEQFTWTFHYAGAQGAKEVVSNQLYLPIDKPVKFTIQSKDVLHDFWVPGFRMKLDAVPGIDTSIRVTPNRIGSYPVVCAELCGLGHAVMRQTAHVVTAGEFDKWLADKQSGGAAGGATGPTGPAGATAQVDGKSVFTQADLGCGSCHTLADAGTSGAIGPNLGEVLKGKDAAFIKESIVNPDKEIADGYAAGIMPPTFGETLDPAAIDALAAYLEKAANG
jgi:cytochrome c oxidase subunit 2